MSEDLWFAISACVFVLVLFGISLLVPRNVRPSRETRSIEAKVDVLQRRVDDIERVAGEAAHDVKNVRMSVGGLATKDSVQQLAVQVAEMRGDVKSVAQSSGATTRSIERIEDFLMSATAETIAKQRNGTGS